MMDSVSHAYDYDDPLRWWPVERQNMFSDAVFSIVATILVVNINLKEEDLAWDSFVLEDALIAHIPKFVAYFACFFIISVYWGCHVRLYNLVVNSNDVLTWLNLILLCMLSFLPLTLSLWSESSHYNISHLPSINLALICFVLTVTIFYVFREGAAHHTVVVSSQKTQCRFIILLYAWFPTLIGLFGIYIYKLEEMALCIVFVLVLLTAVVISRLERWYMGARLLDIAVDQVTQPLPMERIEAFSDGVYAISMTLMAVQTAEQMSKSSSSDQSAFVHIFASSSLAYLTAFWLVSVLWFVHHQLCHNIERSNPVIQYFNTLALSFVGGIPFSSRLIQYYASPEHFGGAHYGYNEEVSVQFHCLVIFFSGFFQALMWLAALFMGASKLNQADGLLLFKAMVIPLISCLTFMSSIFTSHSSAVILGLTILVPFIFGLGNLVHMRRFNGCSRIFNMLFGSRREATTNQGLLESSITDEVQRNLQNNNRQTYSYLPSETP